ncbi:hypothetical protein Patl1_29061 [Pistacia atlantica]|uniref:Uncharacterized protein n=1 Tax=Pistacia atlantica TaxID=434234 RepID=A0ACC1BCD1_9ROSI|nr:hypothetical protein Patl1_29061 [Pistacia atlantica]
MYSPSIFPQIFNCTRKKALRAIILEYPSIEDDVFVQISFDRMYCHWLYETKASLPLQWRSSQTLSGVRSFQS